MDSANQPVVVNFEHVAGMFGGDREATYQGAASAASEGAVSAEEEAMVGAALQALEDAPGDPDVLKAPNDQRAALLQTFLAERALEDGKVVEGRAEALEARFDGHDIGWWRAAIPWIRTKLGRPNRAPRPPFTDEVVQLPDKCRIAILGDWGTGLYGAKPIADTIEHDGDYQALVHLGDVYYSGSEREVQCQFLDLWPDAPGAVSRACNSNHEMYSGGGPYFHLTLGRFEQPTSTFLFQTSDWIFAGLDTAYEEHDLDQGQMDWLNRSIARLEDRRLVLFSHHQLFSQLDRQGPKLHGWLDKLLEQGRIFLWYWGHEHRAVVYDRHDGWQLHARCVGHSGFPYFRSGFKAAPTERLRDRQVFRRLPATPNSPAARVLDGENDYLGDKAARYGPNGFLRLEVDGKKLHEVLVTADGDPLWEGDLG